MTDIPPATEARRPTLEPADAQAIAEQLFGLAAQVRELPGDLDRNYLLDTGQERFVLKVAFGSKHKMLAFQHAALRHLASRLGADQLPRIAEVPAPVDAGDPLPVWRDRDGRECRVRLIGFLAGQTLVRFRPHRPGLLRSLGAAMATLDAALADFRHPDMERDCAWDLRLAGRTLSERLEDVSGTDTAALVQPILERFQRHVEPVLPSLRRSVIHGDGNDHNVLVDKVLLDDVGGEQPRIVGVIDFGDMVYTQLVHEVAIAAAYAGLGKPDPLRAAADVVAGYHSVLPLEEPEIALLFDLIRARIAVSVSMAAYQRRLEPENEYLSVSEAPGLQSLELFSKIDPEFAHCVFRAACGLPPCARGPQVVAWLEANRSTFGKVVDGDIHRAPILDLSVAAPLSAELWHAEALSGEPAAKALAAHLDELSAQSGAGVVLGRYDEPRLLYTGDQFARIEGLEHPETRTIHLGVDLFQPAGSPVYAPLDGVVHSFADNAFDLDYGPTLILQHETDGPDPLVFYTLYGHLDRESLAGKFEGMRVVRGDRIASLGDAEVNGGWAPHLHFQVLLETFGRYGELPGVAAPSDRELWLGICPDPSPMLDAPAETRFGITAGSTADGILSRRREVLGRNLSISYRRHLHIVAGRGSYLFDAEGRSYLDAVNNVPHVGHCHPKVVAAGRDQMAVLNTNTRYLHEDLVAYAERLTATFPDPLNVCIFCCTGSEANDLALRMARSFTGGSHMVVVDGAYHGHTRQLIDLSPYKFDGPGGAGAPGSTHVVPLPCGYRGPYKHDDPEIGSRYAAHVADACSTVAYRGAKVAAFVCESILGCGGQVVLPPGYLAQAYRHARAAGGLCIADEVQVGFGRVGTHMWAFETQGVVPDIVTLGKPIGNGHPLSAVITTAEIADAFANGMEYFNTFGGNPVSCRIGSAVLDVLEAEDLPRNALETGGALLRDLAALKDKHPIVGEARGLGLFVGVELVRDRETLEPAAEAASYIAERMRDHGILISTDGPLHNVLKIKPPMVFGPAEAERLVRTLDGILGEDEVRAAVISN